MKNSNSRRIFLKTVLFSGIALIAMPMVKIQSAFAEMVKATDPLVKALGYVAKASDSKERKDNKATCETCQFYLAPGKPVGKCQLIPSGDVAGPGWCKSFSKRAEIKKPDAKKSS